MRFDCLAWQRKASHPEPRETEPRDARGDSAVGLSGVRGYSAYVARDRPYPSWASQMATTRRSSIRIDDIESVADLLEKVADFYAGDPTVLFRGQSNADWPLTPKLGRTTFRKRFGVSLPDVETKLLAEFERQAVPHLSTRSIQNSWDRLALAQHHGLPTRLLDWSTSPLVALWFAVEKPAATGAVAALWAYNVSEGDVATQDVDPLKATLNKASFRDAQ